MGEHVAHLREKRCSRGEQQMLCQIAAFEKTKREKSKRRRIARNMQSRLPAQRKSSGIPYTMEPHPEL